MHIEGIEEGTGNDGDIPKSREMCILKCKKIMSLKESFSVCFESVVFNVISRV